MHKLMLALAATVASAGSALADPVRISVGSYNLNNLPFPVAQGLGLYEKEGLEVTVENFASGGSKTLQALVAGSTDIAVGFYDHTIQMQSQKKAVVAFVQLARNSGLVLAGGKDSTFDPAKPETIKGAKIGITSPGSSSDFFVRYYLQRNGLSGNDVSLIGVGSGSAAVAALEQGKVDLLVN
jgi:NitT/TauT family transport system substrate-binding protein